MECVADSGCHQPGDCLRVKAYWNNKQMFLFCWIGKQWLIQNKILRNVLFRESILLCKKGIKSTSVSAIKKMCLTLKPFSWRYPTAGGIIFRCSEILYSIPTSSPLYVGLPSLSDEYGGQTVETIIKLSVLFLEYFKTFSIFFKATGLLVSIPQKLAASSLLKTSGLVSSLFIFKLILSIFIFFYTKKPPI